MEKNWLIRTKSNHILGPISKEKVLELYNNGSIKGDDEVCAGNGFWFFIREDDMVTKYLLGNEHQNFNPISEAKNVLSTSTPSEKEPTRDDITIVGTLNLNALKDSANEDVPPAPAAHPAAAATAAPTVSPTKISSAQADKIDNAERVGSGPKKKLKSEVSPKSSDTSKKKLKKQNYLSYIGFAAFIVLILILYYRKSVIRFFFEGETSSFPSLISPVYAQDEEAGKKKSF